LLKVLGKKCNLTGLLGVGLGMGEDVRKCHEDF